MQRWEEIIMLNNSEEKNCTSTQSLKNPVVFKNALS